MNIILQSRNIEPDEALQTFIQRQMEEIDRHGYRLEKLTVELSRVEKKKNDTFSNTVRLIADWPGENIVVERHAEDMKVAIVDAAERLDRVLRKAKEKRRDEQRRNNGI